MKKLVVAKILLISVVPFWMACGKSAVQSELTPTQNNEVKFLTKKAKSPDGVRGLEIAPAGGGGFVGPMDGPNGQGSNLAAADDVSQKLDESLKTVLSVPDLSEDDKGRLTDLKSDIENLVFEAQELEDGVRGLALDDGVRGRIVELCDGVRGLVEQFLKVQDGVRGKAMIDDEAALQINQLDDGVRGFTAQVEELSEKLKNTKSDDGVRGKVALVGNVLVLEGEVADQAFKQLILVVDGREKFAVDVNPETMTYSAKFELNKDDMQKMIIDVVIGNEVLTFLILDGQLQAYNF